MSDAASGQQEGPSSHAVCGAASRERIPSDPIASSRSSHAHADAIPIPNPRATPTPVLLPRTHTHGAPVLCALFDNDCLGWVCPPPPPLDVPRLIYIALIVI
jgi:hypothetical protein